MNIKKSELRVSADEEPRSQTKVKVTRKRENSEFSETDGSGFRVWDFEWKFHCQLLFQVLVLRLPDNITETRQFALSAETGSRGEPSGSMNSDPLPFLPRSMNRFILFSKDIVCCDRIPHGSLPLE
jgi:hypothetical protein